MVTKQKGENLCSFKTDRWRSFTLSRTFPQKQRKHATYRVKGFVSHTAQQVPICVAHSTASVPSSFDDSCQTRRLYQLITAITVTKSPQLQIWASRSFEMRSCGFGSLFRRNAVHSCSRTDGSKKYRPRSSWTPKSETSGQTNQETRRHVRQDVDAHA